MQEFSLERAMTAESQGQNSPTPDPEHARHVPVLFEEVKMLLPVSPGDWVIAATLGGGGHTRIFLEQGARVLGLDADPAAIRRVGESLGKYIASDALMVVQSPFE